AIELRNENDTYRILARGAGRPGGLRRRERPGSAARGRRDPPVEGAVRRGGEQLRALRVHPGPVSAPDPPGAPRERVRGAARGAPASVLVGPERAGGGVHLEGGEPDARRRLRAAPAMVSC